MGSVGNPGKREARTSERGEEEGGEKRKKQRDGKGEERQGARA